MQKIAEDDPSTVTCLSSATPRLCVENTLSFRRDGLYCRHYIPRTDILTGR